MQNKLLRVDVVAKEGQDKSNVLLNTANVQRTDRQGYAYFPVTIEAGKDGLYEFIFTSMADQFTSAKTPYFHVRNPIRNIKIVQQPVPKNDTQVETDQMFPQMFKLGKQRIELEPNCIFAVAQDCPEPNDKPATTAPAPVAAPSTAGRRRQAESGWGGSASGAIKHFMPK